GTVWGCGYNAYGDLGNGLNDIRQLTPVPASGLNGVIALAAGGYHTLALKSDGTVWAWGYNVAGQLGDGTTTDRNIPIQVIVPASGDSVGDGIPDWWRT